MHALQVMGKSTSGVRPVYVLIDKRIMEAIDFLQSNRPSQFTISDYVFAR